MTTIFFPGRSCLKYDTHSASSRASRASELVPQPRYDEPSRTSAMTQLEGSDLAISDGYGTVRRPSPRPPTQRIVFGASLKGLRYVCSNATRRLEYLWAVPGNAIAFVSDDFDSNDFVSDDMMECTGPIYKQEMS